jgi:hypothetical protein
MAEKPKEGKGRLGKALKLFAIILLVLLVPMAMDQFDMDHENVRLAGRIAAGIAGLLFLYGIFSKVMKVLAFVVFLLIGGVVLVTERQIEAPRLKELLGNRGEKGK